MKTFTIEFKERIYKVRAKTKKKALSKVLGKKKIFSRKMQAQAFGMSKMRKKK